MFASGISESLEEIKKTTP
jgi:hypothetical protein